MDEEAIQKEYEDAKDFLHLLQDQSPQNPDRDKIMIALEQLRIKRNMTLEDVKKMVESNVKRKKSSSHKMLRLIETDKIREGARPIQRVGQTFPGIELTHFCTDDNEKKYGIRLILDFLWAKFCFGNT